MEDSRASYSMSLVTLHDQVADAYWDGQLVVGVGVRQRVLTLDANASDDDRTVSLFESSANGIEIGALWRPNDEPFRLGLAFRNALEARARYSKQLSPDAVGDIVVDTADGPFYPPERATLPWDPRPPPGRA